MFQNQFRNSVMKKIFYDIDEFFIYSNFHPFLSANYFIPKYFQVKMVAAGVQTNGITVGARRLTKSFSEVGGDRLTGRDTQSEVAAIVGDR